MEVNWSPSNTVHEVKVDDVPVCFIIKNNYNEDQYISDMKESLLKEPSAHGYIQLSLAYYGRKDYLGSIEASRKAIALDSKNIIAYNNLCTSYNMLKMYYKGKEAGEKARELAGKKDGLIENNLKISDRGIAIREKREYSVKQYLKMSLNSFRLKDFENCIKISYELLDKDPNNLIAFNNICASHNNLKEFELAKEACKKALEIDSNFQLAKNNLQLAEKRLKE